MERYTMRLPDNLGAVPASGYGMPEILDRLAAYEDTGLEPEEIIGRLAKQKVEDIFTAETKKALDKLMEYKTAEKEGRLLVLNKREDDAYPGIKRKYIVLKADTGEGVDNCFVLRPNKDPAANVALEAYAKETENETLAADIINWIGDSGRVLVLPCKVGGDLWVNDMDGKPRRMVLDTPDIRCHCAKEDNLCIALCDSPKDGVCVYRLKNDGTDFGQKIFRTREEAEAALKERENNG